MVGNRKLPVCIFNRLAVRWDRNSVVAGLHKVSNSRGINRNRSTFEGYHPRKRHGNEPHLPQAIIDKLTPLIGIL